MVKKISKITAVALSCLTLSSPLTYAQIQKPKINKNIITKVLKYSAAGLATIGTLIGSGALIKYVYGKIKGKKTENPGRKCEEPKTKEEETSAAPQTTKNENQSQEHSLDTLGAKTSGDKPDSTNEEKPCESSSLKENPSSSTEEHSGERLKRRRLIIRNQPKEKVYNLTFEKTKSGPEEETSEDYKKHKERRSVNDIFICHDGTTVEYTHTIIRKNENFSEEKYNELKKIYFGETFIAHDTDIENDISEENIIAAATKFINRLKTEEEITPELEEVVSENIKLIISYMLEHLVLHEIRNNNQRGYDQNLQHHLNGYKIVRENNIFRPVPSQYFDFKLRISEETTAESLAQTVTNILKEEAKKIGTAFGTYMDLGETRLRKLKQDLEKAFA